MIRRESGGGGVSPSVYLPLAGGTMVGNVIFNDNVSVLLGTGSDGNLYHDGTNTYFKNATGNIYIENDTIDGDIIFKVNDGGVDTTVMTLDGATGNVGIGTTGPDDKLHVIGNIHIGGATTNLYLKPDQPTAGELLAGNWIESTTSGSLVLFGNSGGTAGVGVELPYYNGTSWYSGLELKNVASGFGNLLLMKSGGNVGIVTAAPTNLLSLGGNAARIFWMERHTTADTAGNTLTVTAGGATAGATDKAGGNLLLQGGLSTGSAESGVIIYGCVAGASGTADRTQTTAIQVLGNKIGFFAATAVVKQTGCAVPTDLATAITAITALRTALNNLGLTTVV